MDYVDDRFRCPFVLVSTPLLVPVKWLTRSPQRGMVDMKHNTIVSLTKIPCWIASRQLPRGCTSPQLKTWALENGADPWALE